MLRKIGAASLSDKVIEVSNILVLVASVTFCSWIVVRRIAEETELRDYVDQWTSVGLFMVASRVRTTHHVLYL
ncbi:unnamed protein product [Arabidopsis lyrata]|uniref:Uncharacterized protein n=1 Tax=Arabidopsis lyrata subsp. lyrata TaxID=81972 RepID=D7LK66_ARALL|nr:hypothetical protein ARALYDRAFT_901140 [Arabidopsis lyrata subsp. lyrata]CAH8263501.1 unnamed protein product [Arabidopsis lyrata]